LTLTEEFPGLDAHWGVIDIFPQREEVEQTQREAINGVLEKYGSEGVDTLFQYYSTSPHQEHIVEAMRLLNEEVSQFLEIDALKLRTEDKIRIEITVRMMMKNQAVLSPEVIDEATTLLTTIDPENEIFAKKDESHSTPNEAP